MDIERNKKVRVYDEQKTTVMDEIKQIMLFLLIGGREIKTEQLINLFTILADLSEISDSEDFKNVGLNATTIFVEKSLKMFEKELFDEWIEMFKQELVKLENYELIRHLEL